LTHKRDLILRALRSTPELKIRIRKSF